MRDATFVPCVVCERPVDPWTMCECEKCEACAVDCSCGHDNGCACEECCDRAAGHYGSDGSMAGGDS